MPYFQKRIRNKVPDYRPISLTCVAYKIMETLIKWDVTDHLLLHNLISKQQHGFVSKRSTCNQLLQ